MDAEGLGCLKVECVSWQLDLFLFVTASLAFPWIQGLVFF